MEVPGANAPLLLEPQALGIPDELVRLRGCNVAKGDPVLVAGQIAARACGIDQTAVGALWFGLARYDRSGWLGMTA
jgi:hypothetical protein